MKQKGFTMIELVISIFVLSIGLVGVFSAFSVIAILASDTADRFTATYLAQEGMEIVRNIRETNWLNMDRCANDPECASEPQYTWVDGLTVNASSYALNCSMDGGTGCEADYRTTGDPVFYPMTPWTGNGNYLKIEEEGFYAYNASDPSPTKFKRKIIITPITDVDGKADHIIMVEVQVSWKQKATILNSTGTLDATCGQDNCIKVKGTLYNWYNYATQ